MRRADPGQAPAPVLTKVWASQNRGLLAWLAGALALAILSVAVLTSLSATADKDVLPWFTAMDQPGILHLTWRTVVWGGQFALVAAVAIVLSVARSWLQRSLRAFIVTTTTVMGLDLLLWVTKTAIGRTSPHSGLNEVLAGGASYPSGHTANGTVGLVLIAVLSARGAPRAGRLLVAEVASVAVGIANLVLGYHWPTDVLAGWLLGGLILAISIRLLHLEDAPPPRVGLLTG